MKKYRKRPALDSEDNLFGPCTYLGTCWLIESLPGGAAWPSRSRATCDDSKIESMIVRNWSRYNRIFVFRNNDVGNQMTQASENCQSTLSSLSLMFALCDTHLSGHICFRVFEGITTGGPLGWWQAPPPPPRASQPASRRPPSRHPRHCISWGQSLSSCCSVSWFLE